MQTMTTWKHRKKAAKRQKVFTIGLAVLIFLCSIVPGYWWGSQHSQVSQLTSELETTKLDLAQAKSELDEFSALERWIAEHPNSDTRVDTLAEKVHMSARNFARMYAQKRGRTPAKAVEVIRIDVARRLLEDTDDQIKVIADMCGFRTEERMRSAFSRTVGVPPREYRRRFSTR